MTRKYDTTAMSKLKRKEVDMSKVPEGRKVEYDEHTGQLKVPDQDSDDMDDMPELGENLALPLMVGPSKDYSRYDLFDTSVNIVDPMYQGKYGENRFDGKMKSIHEPD